MTRKRALQRIIELQRKTELASEDVIASLQEVPDDGGHLVPGGQRHVAGHVAVEGEAELVLGEGHPQHPHLGR